MNKQQKGNDDYLQKFIEHGLDAQFDFVCRDWDSDHGRKILVKCKSCNAKFSTWGFREILRGRQSHLLCINCGASSDGNNVWERSSECDEAMAFYVAGHSVKETAGKYGVSMMQINNSVKSRGLSNGLSSGKVPEWFNDQQSKESERRLANRLKSLGLEYVGGYCDKHIRIRCRKCGFEFERCVDFAKRGNVICKHCEHEKALIRRDERKKQRQIESEQKRKEKEIERMRVNPLGLSLYQLEREKKLDKAFICKVCGKKYTPRQYITSCGGTTYSNPGYCSIDCRNIANKQKVKTSHKGRQDSHRHRAKRFGCEYDSSVTLKRLVKRDGLRCAICGEMCNWNDHSWSKYSGPTHPSIDHIIPMSRGGGHIWNNVQVAHIICNSEKGNITNKDI